MAQPDEARIRSIGQELLDQVKTGLTGSARLIEWLLRDESLKLRLFRLVDVLPALDAEGEVVRHLREYLAQHDAKLPGPVRAALGLARTGRLGGKVVGAGVRLTIRRLARRFIVGSTPAEAVRAARAARRAGHAFTLDVLGEACVSEDEAESYQRAYIQLIERLGAEAARWPDHPQIDRAAWGALPKVNISVRMRLTMVFS